MTLAAFAIALKVLIPAGFMSAKPTNDLPFAIVLCTAEGKVSIAPGQTLPTHDDQDGSKANHDSPCVFVGHPVSAPPTPAFALAFASLVAFREAPIRPSTDLAPGRALTGPPLPARGPPTLLI